ncbi:MAG: M48 family metalloprotease, partial [Umezawaea sp.]
MDGAVRVDVLAFPAATTARFLVLVAAMVAAGLFAGSAVFNTAAVGGSAWSADVGACAATAAGASDDPAAQQAAFLDCAASAERERIAFALGAAVVLLLGALVVMVLAPVLIQRRYRLTLPRANMTRTVDRVQVLAAEMGLRTPPLVVLGSSKLGDAFCFGRPGAYRIALPLKLAVKPGKPLFDAAVRHEVAHLRHHDVGWSWLANAVWYVLAPLLLLPVALSLMSADYSVLPDYLWRALVLAGAVHLARRALLRSREHDADLRAARVGGVPAMIDLLRSLPRDARTGRLALHPDRAARLDVVTRPELAVRITAVDGFTVAFFVSLAVPMLGDLAVSGSLSTTVLPFARLAVAALVAPLLGATLGLGLWRQAAVGRLAGARVRVVPVVFGVFVGCVAGEVASFSGTATTWWGQVGSLLPPAVLVTGATALVAGLGELWEQVGGGLRRARGNWVPAVVVSTILFGVALWIGGHLRLAVGTGGWDLASALVSAWMTSPVFAILALALAVAVAVAHRLAWRTRTTPAWLAPPRSRTPDDPRPTRVVMVGVVAGVVGAVVLVGFRASLTAPIQQEQLLDTYLWLAGAVAATAALLVGLLFGAAGRGTALL